MKFYLYLNEDLDFIINAVKLYAPPLNSRYIECSYPELQRYHKLYAGAAVPLDEVITSVKRVA